jgi:hypothetical protein
MIGTLRRGVDVNSLYSNVYVPYVLTDGSPYDNYYFSCEYKSDLCSGLFHLMLLDGSLPIAYLVLQ